MVNVLGFRIPDTSPVFAFGTVLVVFVGLAANGMLGTVGFLVFRRVVLGPGTVPLSGGRLTVVVAVVVSFLLVPVSGAGLVGMARIAVAGFFTVVRGCLVVAVPVFPAPVVAGIGPGMCTRGLGAVAVPVFLGVPRFTSPLIVGRSDFLADGLETLERMDGVLGLMTDPGILGLTTDPRILGLAAVDTVDTAVVLPTFLGVTYVTGFLGVLCGAAGFFGVVYVTGFFIVLGASVMVSPPRSTIPKPSGIKDFLVFCGADF